jgi:hypothetical protein
MNREPRQFGHRSDFLNYGCTCRIMIVADVCLTYIIHANTILYLNYIAHMNIWYIVCIHTFATNTQMKLNIHKRRKFIVSLGYIFVSMRKGRQTFISSWRGNTGVQSSRYLEEPPSQGPTQRRRPVDPARSSWRTSKGINGVVVD